MCITIPNLNNGFHFEVNTHRFRNTTYYIQWDFGRFVIPFGGFRKHLFSFAAWNPSLSYSFFYSSMLVGRWHIGNWLQACGLVLELKPPKVQWFEVSHLPALIAESYSVKRPLIPAWTRRKTGNGMQIVKKKKKKSWCWMSQGSTEGVTKVSTLGVL